jgi:hypothetical protein
MALPQNVVVAPLMRFSFAVPSSLLPGLFCAAEGAVRQGAMTIKRVRNKGLRTGIPAGSSILFGVKGWRFWRKR